MLIGVHAGRGGEEEPIDVVALGGEQQIGVDEHREHAQGLVVLDEPHATHVGGEVEDIAGAHERIVAGGGILHVGDDDLGPIIDLVPLRERLPVDGPDVLSCGKQILDEVTADESAGSCDNSRLHGVEH